MEYLRGMTLPLLFLGMLLSSVGCTGPACVSGNGTIVTEKHPLPPFSNVRFDGPGTLYLSPGETTSLVLIGDSAFLPQYNYRVEGNTLVINADLACIARGTRAPDLYVTGGPVSVVTLTVTSTLSSPSLIKTTNLSLVLEGSGKVDLPVECDSLITNLSGTSEVFYRGSTPVHTVIVTGSGRVRAYDLVTNATSVNISGAGGVDLYARDTLSTTISGSGSVRYIGDPVLQKQMTGSGSVTRA